MKRREPPLTSSGMFLIVEFTETKTVNIIPESWFEDGVTKWPNYQSDKHINRAVQTCEEPGEDWKLYDVRVLSRTGEYLRAREKLKASMTCNTSELQTDEEEFVKKRKVKKRHMFGDTESDSEPNGSGKKRHGDFSSTPWVSSPIPNMTNKGFETPSRPTGTGNTISLSGDHQVFNPTFRLGKTGTGSIPCSAAQLHILTLLEHIKEQQMQLAVAVNNLAARIGTETPMAEMPHSINLPLDTLSEVDEFEEWLKDSRNSHAKQNMISVLGAVGGQNAKKVTWNILSRIFSDAVAKQINWKGANRKKCFKEMVTRSLLIRAVRKNHSTGGATDTEIDSFTIRWFNLACDRGGGRKERGKDRCQQEA
ncbi:uncharacterized protein [Paramormyrops kingsleyae]|uniref:uncharacterized protein n=1 Tax=Paramormyrops kingsleyae TaxID=1676925 RepID=UPI003B96BE7E